MEMNKLIPELGLRFDIEMAEKDAKWTVYNDWFVKQEGFRVKVSKRQETSVVLYLAIGLGFLDVDKGYSRSSRDLLPQIFSQCML